MTEERILVELKLTHDSFLKWGVNQSRIAVAGFNPRAGQGGLLGHEKIEEIEPVVKKLNI